MRGRGKITVICLALAIGLSFGLAADAGAKAKPAKKSRVSSGVTLSSVGPDGAGGQVSSPSKACRAQRRVSFYRVNTGPSVPSSEPVTSTWTRGDGSWSVPGPLFPSEFFAVVERSRAGGVVCLSAVSNAREVE